jgi:hypothetical protein
VKKHLFPFIPLLGLAALSGCPNGIEPIPFQGISGTVNFIGDVPENTDWVRLVVYKNMPQQPLDLLNFIAFTDTLPLALTSSPYLLALSADEYAWLPLVWKEKDADLTPDALRVIGWYTAGGDPFDPPRSVSVQEGRETDGVTLIGDFGTLLSPAEALERIR